ncbi:MAG: hypothetical protein IPG74_06925 [Flavobacteriales bacterium]|nr:hypothetical protein [Flavobacteriales bacterium]
MNQWFNLILFCSIPVNALLSYWLYERHGYNYAEHLMLNGLLRGASLLLFCAFTPLLRWYGDLWFTWIGIYFRVVDRLLHFHVHGLLPHAGCVGNRAGAVGACAHHIAGEQRHVVALRDLPLPVLHFVLNGRRS